MQNYIVLTLIFVVVYFNKLVDCVDRSNFKTCDQTAFCRRHRNQKQNESPWILLTDSLEDNGEKLDFRLRNEQNGISLKATLFSLVNGEVFRLKINEINAQRERFEATDALLTNIPQSSFTSLQKSENGFEAKSGENKIVVNANPFRIDVYSGDQLVISGNQRGLFKFEHFRPKSVDPYTVDNLEETDDNNEGETNENKEIVDDCTDGCWEETFKTHTDSKPFGPMSVGCDFTFVNFEHVYGIPEHADKFSLKNTKGSTDPYRLYNVDIFEYEPETPMSLYGAIPLMIAHSPKRTVGLLWLNPSETLIDIESSNSGFTGMISNLVSGDKQNKLTHWISETGVVDVFFLLGPKSSDVMSQYAKLTGTTPLPPLYSLGYHQCRWNYWTQGEVNDVDVDADNHDVPLDAIWLDIEYTDGRSKKYFTWDPVTFGDAKTMVSNLTAKGRRLITIIDPHIKKDTNYHIYNEGVKNGYFTKDKNDNDYEGWCWPGSSYWADYLNPEVREWWADKFNPQHFPGFDGIVDIWNDMNEPSVFSGPEVTAPRDMKHFGGVEHRDVHNMYGFLMTKSTYAGLIKHRPNLRAFILTRSFFAGSQRYASAWTGDNMSKWEHLKMAIPMLLSHSVTGMTFIGADIPGFFFNPESEELVVRWYQASIFHPFFRGHAHLDTKRREPWTFSEATKSAIRDVIQLRYKYMPYLYKLFYENELNGMPPMRPLWMEFDEDSKTFAIDDAYMLGNALLVHPVQERSTASVNVYFPGDSSTAWIHITTHHVYSGGHSHSIQADLTSVPIFQRSGTIVTKRERTRRSALLAINDPLSLDVFIDNNGLADGTLYLDDGQTFNYRSGDYIYGRLLYGKKVLNYEKIGGNYNTKVWLERVTIYGYPSKPVKIQWISGDKSGQLAFKYDDIKRILVIRKPSLIFSNEWQIKIT